MSSPVSLLSTSLSISTGKRWVERILGDSLNWLTAAQDSIASCATEQKFGFLLQVLWAGALGWAVLMALAILANLLDGSTLGACGGGVSDGGSTIGAATLGSNLGGIIGNCVLCGKRGGGGSGLVVSCGKKRGWGCGGWIAGGADCETGISGTAAASENIWLRLVSSASRDS